jgi:hypothetical protein
VPAIALERCDLSIPARPEPLARLAAELDIDKAGNERAKVG